MEISFEAQIVKALGKLGSNGTTNPDAKHNVGSYLGQLFMWNTVRKAAEGQVKNLWDTLEARGIIDIDDLDPGDHELARSPHFVTTAKVSQPVKRFDAQKLANALNKKYKVPVPIALEMIEAAKSPTKSTVTKAIIEKTE